MSTYHLKTHPALTDGSLASRSLASIDFSLHGDWFVVPTILPQKRAIAFNSRSDGVESDTLSLWQNASTFGKIDTLKIVCHDSPGKTRLGLTIHFLHQLKLQTSQFSKWYISPTQQDVALDPCNTDTRACSNVLGQVISYFWQSFARFWGQSQNSRLLPAQTDRNSDTIFEARGRDRLFDYNTAILHDLRSGTDKILPSLYRVLVLRSTLEALPA